jgi:cell division protein FtsX
MRRLNNYFALAAVNLVIGLGVPGIDLLGHIGGFVGGLILGWLLCPFYQVAQQANGSHYVIDRNSLRAEWLGVALVSVLMVVAFWAALQYHQADPLRGFLK